MPQFEMLSAIVKSLDQSILSDSSLSPALFDQLIAAQHELGLVFGERPTCRFLRPHLVGRAQYDEITCAAGTIARSFEKLVAAALADNELLQLLGLTEAETRMARIDPGYSGLCVSSRLDATISGSDFQFLEYNAETPAGISDQMQLEKVLFGLNHVEELLRVYAHWRPEPHKHLLTALVDTYRDWGGEEERPQIAIVDWQGVATESEFRVLQEYFSAAGCSTVIADPRELRYDGQHLAAGDFRIDMLYKRVIIHEFLERCGEDHPLARAYRDGHLCMANSFRTKIAHKKAAFAILRDPHYAHLFTSDELELFERHIPWTRLMKSSMTTFHEREQSLIPLVRAEQERFVLKPNDDYGGHGVFLGWETTADDWDRAIAIAGERAYVVQERVPTGKISMTTFSDRVRLEEMFVDFNPFLFRNEAQGALIRLSSSSMLNVTSGGGQTALLVLEDF